MPSYEERVDMITMVAGFDASATSNRFVSTGADGKCELTAAGEKATGVLTIGAPENHACRVVIDGIVPIEAGGPLTAGQEVEAGADGVAVVLAAGEPLGVVQAGAPGEPTVFADGNIVPILFRA